MHTIITSTKRSFFVTADFCNTERSSGKLNRFRRQSHYSQKCATSTVLFSPFHLWHYFWKLAKRVRGCSPLTLTYTGHLAHLHFLNREVNWHFNPIYKEFYTNWFMISQVISSVQEGHMADKCRKFFFSCTLWGMRSFPLVLTMLSKLLRERCPHLQSNLLPMARAMLKGFRAPPCSNQWMRFLHLAHL